MEIQRGLNLGYGLTRVVFGMVATSMPRKLGRTWIGDDADTPGATVVLRALGVRDIALGAGTVVGALGDDADLWLATCVLADLGDVAGTISGRKELPENGVKTTVVLAGMGALAGIALLAISRTPE